MPKLELTGFLNHSLGAWHPQRCLTDAIDGPEEAAALAVEYLHREGFADEDFRLFLGPEAVEIREEVERQQGLLGRVAHSFASIMSAEWDAMNDYLDHVEKGGAVVAVHCPEPSGPPEKLRGASGGGTPQCSCSCATAPISYGTTGGIPCRM